MDNDESLSSILGNDSAPVETAPVVAAEPVKVETPTPARDEGGKFAKPAGEAPAPVEVKPVVSQTPVVEKPPVNVAAIIDERRRRQAAEQERDELRQRLAADPAARPSVFQDEDAAISLRVQEQVAPIREGLFYQSMEIARSRHGEGFAEAEAAFATEAETNPQLVAALRASSNPGAFVYSEGLRIKELAEVGGDFGAYKQKLTASHTAALAEKDTRITALQAELDALKKTNTDLQSLPRSLNRAASGAPIAGEDDDEDLSSIVRFNNKSG